MEFNRGTFILFVVFFILFTPAGNPPHLTSPDEKDQYRNYLQLQRNETEILKNSTYNSLPGNITGITHPSNEESFIPQPISNIAKALWFSESSEPEHNQTHQLPHPIEEENGDIYSPLITRNIFFSNYSGTFHGFWDKPDHDVLDHLTKREMSIPQVLRPSHRDTDLDKDSNNTEVIYFNAHPQMPTMDKVLMSSVDGNITESEGKLSISIDEVVPRGSKNTNVTIITMDIVVNDVQEASQYSMSLMGLHIKPTGNIVLSTNSLKYSGLQYLPHLLLDETYFDEAKNLMIRFINNTLNSYEDEQDYLVFEDKYIASGSCEFIFYGHFHSVSLTQQEMSDIEEEIEVPVGRPTKPIPKMILDSLIYSPDCAFAIKSQHVEGEKYEQYWKRIRQTLLLAVILIISQTYLLAQQMRHTNTPSYLCKVNYYTIGMMSVIDGSVWVASFASSFIEDLALPFMAIAFLAFGLTTMFELRYLVKIYHSQLPAGEEDLSELAVSSKIYTRFYFSLLGFVIATLVNSTWPISLRRIYEFVVILLFYSIWVPQIHRNVMKGFRRSFLWRFVIGTSVIRVIPVLYFTLNTKNILRHHYDPTLAIATVTWVCIQLLALYTQTVFGPRFFLPKGYLPALYDYHPILTQGDIETGINNVSESAAPVPVLVPVPEAEQEAVGPSSENSSISSETSLLGIKAQARDENSSYDATSADTSVAKQTVDCAICMMPVELVITPKDSPTAFVSSPALMLARRRYMVTPCKHVFHTECMEKWMRTRLQCPICRNSLPPV